MLSSTPSFYETLLSTSRPRPTNGTPPHTPHNILICDDVAKYTQQQMTIRVYLMIPAMLFGLITQIMNICIFLSREMRKQAINWFIVALCFSDILIVIASFLMFSCPALIELSGRSELYVLSNMVMRWTYPLATIAHTLNVYLTVVLSAHRFIGVCYPLRARQLMSGKFVRLAIVITLLFAIVFNGTRFVEMSVHECWSSVENETSYMLFPAPILYNETYFVLFRVILYSLIMFIAPFVLLILLNTSIIRTLWLSKHARQQMTQRTTLTPKKESRVSLMDDPWYSLRNSYLLRKFSAPARHSTASRPDASHRDVKLVSQLVRCSIDIFPPATKNDIQTARNNQLMPNSLYPYWPNNNNNNNNSVKEVSNNNNPNNRLLSITLESPDQTPTAYKRQPSVRTRNISSTSNSLLTNTNKLKFSPVNRAAAERNMTVILLGIVSVFLVCNALPFINNIIDILHYYGLLMRQLSVDSNATSSSDNAYTDWFQFSVELGNFTVVLNSASSIFVYYLFGSKYRRSFTTMVDYLLFCCRVRKQPTGISSRREANNALQNGHNNVTPHRQPSTVKRSDSIAYKKAVVQKRRYVPLNTLEAVPVTPHTQTTTTIVTQQLEPLRSSDV